MTDTRTSGRPATPPAGGYINRHHLVTGTPAQLVNIATNYRNAGTLVTVTPPRPISDDRFEVVFSIREYQPGPPTVRISSVGEHVRTRTAHRRRTRRTVIVSTVIGTTAGCLAVAAYLIGQLVELIAAHAVLILGVLALAALLSLGAARRKTSGRRHCPGC